MESHDRVEVDASGTIRHYLGDLLHSTEGPAVIWTENNTCLFMLRGNYYQFRAWCSILNKSPAEITALKIVYNIT